MAHYDYQEVMKFFSEKLQAELPEDDFAQEGLDLRVDHYTCALLPGKEKGGLVFSVPLGMLLQPLSDEHLKELATSNFLGVNTGGCTLCCDQDGVTLSLKAAITVGTPPQECWEWLHRLLSVAEEWRGQLGKWDEWMPLGGS